MGRDGRIGNRALLQRLADFFQMEGVRRYPPALNTDMVQVVQPLTWPGSSYALEGGSGSVALAGTSGATRRVAGPATAALFPATGVSPIDTTNKELRILAAFADIFITAADVAVFAAANDELSLDWAIAFPHPTLGPTFQSGINGHHRIGLRTYAAGLDVHLRFYLFGGSNAANIKSDISTGNQTPDTATFPGLGTPFWLPAGCELGVSGLVSGAAGFTGGFLSFNVMGVSEPTGFVPPM